MKSIPVSLGSDSCARDDERPHNARAPARTQAHRLSRGRGILEVYNGPAFAHRDVRASYGEAGVARYTRRSRKLAIAASNASGCSRFARRPVAGIVTSSEPAMPRGISAEADGGG